MSTTPVKERPILFSAPMVRAILEGRKTQTRRVVKPQPSSRDTALKYPYGKPGDRLWVREAHAIVPRTAYAASEGVIQTLRPDNDHDAAIYREGWARSTGGIRWRPSIHMPRWACRVVLDVVSVRAELLVDITEGDALAEGAALDLQGVYEVYGQPGMVHRTARSCFETRWNILHGPCAFARNPLVWVVEFRRVPAEVAK